MTHPRLLKSAGAAGVCAAVGMIAGIAGSAAAPEPSGKIHGGSSGPVSSGLPGPPRRFFMAGGPAVHAVQIVANKAGDGFDTVTQDAGTVKSISDRRLTITEGTDKATYATPTFTVAAEATVERDFQKAKLADIQVGDHVDVTSTAAGPANVFAIDAQHWPPKGPEFITKGGPLPAPSFGGSAKPPGVANGFAGP